jgi:RNA polymerase primary sigma factor
MRQLTITQSITNRDSQSVERYLQEISKLDMISMEQEVQLARSIRGGDEQALDKLVRANLRFVVSVAKQYQSRGMSLADLINEGNVGLIKAAKRFDETKGFKFISYAVWWIRQGIIQALAEQGRIVRMPSNRVNLGIRVQKIIAGLEQLHQRAPSTAELAEELNINEEHLYFLTEYNMHHVSLDAPNIHTEESMSDTLVDENVEQADRKISYKQSLEIEVMRCLQTLSERERNIICYFFGIGVSEPLSLHDIASKYSMTGERIRQIKDKAISQLRSPKRARLLKEYLGA